MTSGFDLQRREAIKLDLLESLSRSQRALARILESVADVADASDSDSVQLLRQLDVLARSQMTLAKHIAGIRFRSVVRGGNPLPPWTNKDEKPAVFRGVP
jgi:hypothetical protein